MRLILNENREVISIAEGIVFNEENRTDIIEITEGFIPEDRELWVKWGVCVYTVDTNGKITKRTDEELKAEPAYVEYQKRMRASEYPKEADPLFFKYQRGEATEQEWKDAVQAVKSRFPY